MAIVELPLTSDAAQSFSVQLGDAKFYFEARYNSRNGVWALDMYDDATRSEIAIGLAILVGQDLLDPYNFPYGALVAIDRTGLGKDAGPDDLGSRVALFWVSPDEDFA